MTSPLHVAGSGEVCGAAAKAAGAPTATSGIDLLPGDLLLSITNVVLSTGSSNRQTATGGSLTWSALRTDNPTSTSGICFIDYAYVDQRIASATSFTGPYSGISQSAYAWSLICVRGARQPGPTFTPKDFLDGIAWNHVAGVGDFYGSALGTSGSIPNADIPVGFANGDRIVARGVTSPGSANTGSNAPHPQGGVLLLGLVGHNGPNSETITLTTNGSEYLTFTRGTTGGGATSNASLKVVYPKPGALITQGPYGGGYAGTVTSRNGWKTGLVVLPELMTSPAPALARTTSATPQNFSRTATDSLFGSDVATKSTQSFARTASDVLFGSDTAVAQNGKARSATDALFVSDVATRAVQSFSRTAADSLFPGDTATRTSTRSRTTTDVLLSGDVATRTVARPRSTTDALLGTDTATRGTLSFSRTATDVLLGADSTGKASTFGRTASDVLFPGAITITDSFNRANSTSTLGTTDTGQTWVAASGTWGIDTNRAYVASQGPANQNFAWVETGASDGTLQLTWVETTGGAEDGPMIFRAVDANNHWVVAHSGNAWQFFKCAAGTYTQVGFSSANDAPANGDVMSLVLSGSSFTLKRNGTTVHSLTDTTYQTATKHGLRLYTGALNGSRYDDFSFLGPGSSADVATRLVTAQPRAVSDSLLGADSAVSSFTPGGGPARTAADALLGSDVATRTLVLSRTAADSLVGADVATRIASRSRTGSDSLLGGDVATRGAQSFSRTATDALVGADTATRTRTTTRTTADSLLGTDVATRQATFTRTGADSLVGTDTATRTVARPRTTADALLGTDTATRTSSRNRTAADTLLGSDFASTGGSPLRVASDVLLGSDTASRLLTTARTATDALLGTDAATRAVVRPRTASDALIGSDVATRTLTRSRSASDALLGADVATVTRGFARAVVDVLLGGDVASIAPRLFARLAVDALLGNDTATTVFHPLVSRSVEGGASYLGTAPAGTAGLGSSNGGESGIRNPESGDSGIGRRAGGTAGPGSRPGAAVASS